MNALPYILVAIILLSLIFSYLSMINNKNSFEIISDMGIGYNLGNTFDSFDVNIYEMNSPKEQITLNGNTLPTKNMIKKLNKNKKIKIIYFILLIFIDLFLIFR